MLRCFEVDSHARVSPGKFTVLAGRDIGTVP